MTKEPKDWTNSLNDFFSEIILRAMLVGIGSACVLFGGILLLLGDTPLGVFTIIGGLLVFAAFLPHT